MCQRRPNLIINKSSHVYSIRTNIPETRNILAFASNPYLIMKINLMNNMLLNLETLPKPYVPSAVPLFTGREDKIEEITTLITEQSTRLLNIWGSPGFGKTSTAIEVARHLLSLDCPVYFFKLQSISTVDEFLSKILGIFRSNLVDLSLRPIDKVVSIFREISSPIFLIFDNVDDFLSSESGSARLTHLFEELLDSNVNINIIFTTRGFLENMREQVEGFQDIRIRPLHPVSSVEFVRQLLPSFSESVVAKVAEICSHVPLAMKLVASLVENNDENIANQILEELSLSGNILEQIDSKYEKNMRRLFEVPFEKLTLSDKHALISLTVFSSGRISKDAAIRVVSGEMGVAEVARTLKTLVKKALIDEDPSGEYYTVHPLICSFVLDKAKQSEFEAVFKSSRVRFGRYYFLLFEKLNDKFLVGKSIESPQLEDMMQHLPIVVHQCIASDFENFQHLFRVLSKSEIFLFLIVFHFDITLNVPKIYDLAIETCTTHAECNKYAYSKLYVSKYFHGISSSIFFKNIQSDIPENTREEVMLLSDGSAAKLGCYEGISLIAQGYLQSGIEHIQKHLDGLQHSLDQQLVKCLCLQLLALLHTGLKEYSESTKLSRRAIKVCEKLDSYNLFLISDCEQISPMTQSKDQGEQLILFVHLLCNWSRGHFCSETKQHLFNFVQKLQQQLENKPFGSHYLFQIIMYGDCLLACLGVSVGQGILLDDKIKILNKSLLSDDCCSLPTNIMFPSALEMSPTSSHLDRLFLCYSVKMSTRDSRSVDTCREALDLSLRHYGKQHANTAFCYRNMGFAEIDAKNYSSALEAFDQALEIMTAIHDGGDSSSADLAEVYVGKGNVYECLCLTEFAIASFEEALKIKKTLLNTDDSEEIAQILIWLGSCQLSLNRLSSSLATLQQALEISLKLYAEKPNRMTYKNVIVCYVHIANVHYKLGNNTQSESCVKSALEVNAPGDKERLCAQSLICLHIADLKLCKNIYMELLDCRLTMVEEYNISLIPILYLKIGSTQLESGQYDAGLASLNEALDIELEVTLQEVANIRECTVSCYISMVSSLFKIGKSNLARRAVDRVIKIAESLPELGRQHLWVFRCYTWKGRIHNAMQEYVPAIESLEHALLQLPKISQEDNVKSEEFLCRKAIAAAYFNEKSYQDALFSMYHALSLIKDIFPKGSACEAASYLQVAAIARELKNKRLEVNNLRLAHKMFSKILGSNHPMAEQCYITYVRALIN